MNNNYSAWLIGAAALAILALIGFQVRWMNYSRTLLEEQFNNRVNMALCSTVEKLANDSTSSEELRACCAEGEGPACQQNFDALRRRPEMQAALAEQLRFYQIDLPFEVLIQPRTENKCSMTTPFSCSLDPILEGDTHFLQLKFAGKEDYFLQRMGLMIGSSVAILFFICLMFGLATWYLVRQQRMSDRNRDFFNQMTHEFRTPLTNIRLASSMLTRKQPELADNTYLGIVRRECDQLTHQVENVLYLASLEKGDYRLQTQPVDLRRLTSDVIAGMDLQIRERGAEVRLIDTPGSDAPGAVRADVFHLGNAFRNLLDNALKYSGERPKVEIGFLPEAAGWRVRFTDNGKGLSPRERRRIFRKFHRCDDALCSGEKGFGLGLAYVKKIVEMHRGQIAVSSEPGCGTRFEIFLPN
jgi:two-component system phosphate regulon sensor histidine kinase PhoR